MPAKATISLVVTDLDNTLYDWVSYFVPSFYAMVDAAGQMLDVSREQLLDELRHVHRAKHDSEYPYALLETPSVKRRFQSCSRLEMKTRLKPAFDAFNAKRDETLTLYPGVLSTLTAIADRGVAIVGHTEASVPNALFRLHKLKCTHLIKHLYALEHVGDEHPDPDRADWYRQQAQFVSILRQHERKPNPEVLLTICRAHGIPPSATLYVGDSIARDIGMAHEAGAWSAYAAYGTHFDRSLWDSLVRVTHWTSDDISRNEEARKRYGGCRADVVLHHGMSELLSAFEFVATTGRHLTT